MHKEKLAKFIEHVKNIPEIIAVCYVGSTASETWDKYSDLDILLVVKDKDYRKVRRMQPKLFEFFGKIKFQDCFPKTDDEFWAFVGDDYFSVDMDILKKSKLRVGYEFKKARIVFDRDGKLTECCRRARTIHFCRRTLPETKSFLLNIRSNFIGVAGNFMRNRKLYAVSEIDNISAELFGFMAEVKKVAPFELLRQEEKLSAQEKIFMGESRYKSRDMSEVKRALFANWKYMKYLENEYEKRDGRKLNLKCNDKEILDIINKTFN
jgi:predicted nucleotidyltransferase